MSGSTLYNTCSVVCCGLHNASTQSPIPSSGTSSGMQSCMCEARVDSIMQWHGVHVYGMGIIGASLSEPHINGTAVRELYIIIYYGTSVTRNYIPSDALRT